jgi:hypothetical protein
MISNGGDSSPSKWVIVGRRSLQSAVSGHAIPAGKTEFSSMRIVDNRSRSAK